jgi:hypothetical protein
VSERPPTYAASAPPRLVIVETPFSPRVRLVLIAIRRALLIVADALAVACDLPDKGIR